MVMFLSAFSLPTGSDENGICIAPLTALPVRVFLWSVSVSMIFYFINIVNSEQGAGEGRCLTEGDEEGLVDLARRIDGGSPKEEDESADGEDGGR